MLIGTSMGTIGAIATSENVAIVPILVPIGDVYSLFGRSKAITNGACFPNTLNNTRLNERSYIVLNTTVAALR